MLQAHCIVWVTSRLLGESGGLGNLLFYMGLGFQGQGDLASR